VGTALRIPHLEPQAYLEWESAQAAKHEYVKGEVFAMVGATSGHVTVALNVAIALRQSLRGGPCRVFVSDMKLHVARANAYFYPDVLVTCDPHDLAQQQFKSNPVLIVEVLSESTAGYDRGEKFAHYRSLDSLREYLLIDPDKRLVDLFRRDDAGNWALITPAATDQVMLASVGVTIAQDILFEDVPPASGATN